MHQLHDEPVDEIQDEMDYLRSEQSKRKVRRENNIKLYRKIIKKLFYAHTSIILFLYLYLFTIEKQFDFKGKVEDNCQDLETLYEINNKIKSSLYNLTYQKFFRILRVNLENECPFWVGDFICNNKKCAICECHQNDIPLNWLKPQNAIQQPNVDQAFWGPERYQEDCKSFIHIYIYQATKWVWHVEDLNNDQGVYVDLKLNPEAYTGYSQLLQNVNKLRYQGKNIWATIYNENCFQGGQWDLMCREERALNKMISGLHTSISIQLTEHYLDLKGNKSYPNYPLFFEKVGNNPERIKNLMFLYSVLLRAFNVAFPAIQAYDINSQKLDEDMEAKYLINEIYDITLSQCSHPFDEKQFFKEIKLVGIVIKQTYQQDTKIQYQKFIHNISMIMDCVECEKCKLYGKMQTYGLGTALKILFSDSPDSFLGTIKRNELIAFVNTLAKISSSVNSVSLMFERRFKYWKNVCTVITFTGWVLLLFLKCCLKIYENMEKKFKKTFNGMGDLQTIQGRRKNKQD